MYELKKIGKVFTSKFVGTGPSFYKKIIYRAAVSQRLRNTVVEGLISFSMEFHVALTAPRNCRWLLDFRIICGPLVLVVVAATK